MHALVLPARDEPLAGVLKLRTTGRDRELAAPETVELKSTVYGR